MRVLLATSDPVRLSFLLALLRDAGLHPIVLDAEMHAVSGGLPIFARRLAVAEKDAAQALRLLREIGETEGLC
jgi:Tfp pilus assembly PilM family ATPase